MQDILTGQYAPRRAAGRSIRLVTWNIERGERLPDVARFIEYAAADIYTLQEVDLNAKRTANLHIAEALARPAKLDYALGIAFRELNQGAGALQGQATLSRMGLTKPRVVHFRYQSDFWKARWWVPNTPPFQERAGGRIALVTEIPWGNGFVVVYNLHLESRGNEELRARQLNEVIADANRYPNQVPVVIAGDLNTKHRSSPCIRLLMDAGFQDVIGDPKRFTTNRGGRFARILIDGALDWIWVRGPIRYANGKIHTDIPRASDHWPLSVDLTA